MSIHWIDFVLAGRKVGECINTGKAWILIADEGEDSPDASLMERITAKIDAAETYRRFAAKYERKIAFGKISAGQIKSWQRKRKIEIPSGGVEARWRDGTHMTGDPVRPNDWQKRDPKPEPSSIYCIADWAAEREGRQ